MHPNEELLFGLFRNDLQSDIIRHMRFAHIVSILMTSLALNAQTMQGRVVCIADGDTITIFGATNTYITTLQAQRERQQ